jgi:hypothetical protein
MYYAYYGLEFFILVRILSIGAVKYLPFQVNGISECKIKLFKG